MQAYRSVSIIPIAPQGYPKEFLRLCDEYAEAFAFAYVYKEGTLGFPRFHLPGKAILSGLLIAPRGFFPGGCFSVAMARLR